MLQVPQAAEKQTHRAECLFTASAAVPKRGQDSDQGGGISYMLKQLIKTVAFAEGAPSRPACLVAALCSLGPMPWCFHEVLPWVVQTQDLQEPAVLPRGWLAAWRNLKKLC